MVPQAVRPFLNLVVLHSVECGNTRFLFKYYINHRKKEIRMAIKIVLKSTANFGGANTPDWYRHDTENLSGVTNLPANKALGLDDILVFTPSDAQASNGMVCATILKTLVGDIRATVYQSKNSPGTVYLRPPQSREEKEDGEIVYHDEVKMPSKLVAQVLRYIETQVNFVDEEANQSQEDLAGVGAGANPFPIPNPDGAGTQEVEDPFGN
jgi:hypothetical protein